MFNSVYQHNVWLGAVAGLSIIFAAVYTLWMVQKAFYGEAKEGKTFAIQVPANTQLMLVILVIFVVAFGVYPQPMINLTNDTVTKLIAQIK